MEITIYLGLALLFSLTAIIYPTWKQFLHIYSSINILPFHCLIIPILLTYPQKFLYFNQLHDFFLNTFKDFFFSPKLYSQIDYSDEELNSIEYEEIIPVSSTSIHWLEIRMFI